MKTKELKKLAKAVSTNLEDMARDLERDPMVYCDDGIAALRELAGLIGNGLLKEAIEQIDGMQQSHRDLIPPRCLGFFEAVEFIR